jgi:hypothetical protein
MAGELRLVESNITSDGGTPIANLPAVARKALRSAWTDDNSLSLFVDSMTSPR